MRELESSPGRILSEKTRVQAQDILRRIAIPQSKSRKLTANIVGKIAIHRVVIIDNFLGKT